MVTGANRQLHRQSSQNPHSLNDTIGSHADRQTSTMTETPSDPVNQIAQAIEKLANRNPPAITFSPKKYADIQRKKCEIRIFRRPVPYNASYAAKSN